MGRLNAFDDGLALEPQALRALLLGGNAQERVWAAWALGLRLGGAFTTEATAQSRREPDPGVRRHLVVLLAGLQEGTAIRTIAANDPDPYVRATAHRYAVQTIGSDAFATALSAATSDSSEIVREECVRVLAGRWPSSRLHDLIGLLADRAIGVRQAAMDRLSEHTLVQSDLPALMRRAIEEPDPDLRHRLVIRVVEAAGAGALALALPDQPVSNLVELLDHMHSSGLRMSWNELATLTTRGIPSLDRRILQLLRDTEGADLLWLARCAVRALAWPPPRNRIEADVAWDVRVVADAARRALVAKVAGIDPLPLVRDEVLLFSNLIESMRSEEAELRAEEESLADDPEWDPAWPQQLSAQRRRLEMFVADVSREPGAGRER